MSEATTNSESISSKLGVGDSDANKEWPEALLEQVAWDASPTAPDTLYPRDVARVLDAAVAWRDPDGTPEIVRPPVWGYELVLALNAAEAERDALREALQTYGQHAEGCAAEDYQFVPERSNENVMTYTARGDCDCGLAAALAAPVAPTPEPPKPARADTVER